MLDGIGDGFLGGAGEGFLDWAFGGGRAAGAAGEIGAGEGMLSGAMRWLTTAADLGWDYMGIKGAWDQFKGDRGLKMSPEGIKHLQNGVVAHSMFTQQLGLHADKNENIKRAYEAYAASGHELPAEHVIANAQQQIKEAICPSGTVMDANQEHFLKQVDQAADHLLNPLTREAHAEALSSASGRDTIKQLHAQLSKANWDKISDHDMERLLIEGPRVPPKPLTGMAKWAHDLTPAKRTGLLFGAVTAVVVGGYAVAKIMEKHKKQAASVQKETQPGSHVGRLLTQPAQTAGIV